MATTQDQQTKEAQLHQKVEVLLALDSPNNYLCWEDAESAILDELEDEEQELYTTSGSSQVEEWFAANEGEESGEEDETEKE